MLPACPQRAGRNWERANTNAAGAAGIGSILASAESLQSQEFP